MNFTRSIVANFFVLTSVSTVKEVPSRGVLVKAVVQVSYVPQIRWDGDLKERSIECKISPVKKFETFQVFIPIATLLGRFFFLLCVLYDRVFNYINIQNI